MDFEQKCMVIIKLAPRFVGKLNRLVIRNLELVLLATALTFGR